MLSSPCCWWRLWIWTITRSSHAHQGRNQYCLSNHPCRTSLEQSSSACSFDTVVLRLPRQYRGAMELERASAEASPLCSLLLELCRSDKYVPCIPLFDGHSMCNQVSFTVHLFMFTCKTWCWTSATKLTTWRNSQRKMGFWMGTHCATRSSSQGLYLDVLLSMWTKCSCKNNCN